MEEVVILIAVSTFTFCTLEVAVTVPPNLFVKVIAAVQESLGNPDEAFPVDCAKYQSPAEQATVLVLFVKTQLELGI